LSKIYLLNGEKFEGVLNLPCIGFDYYDKSVELESFDAVIFTSKNGVKAIDRVDRSWREKEIYSIGKGTSAYLRSIEVEPIYTAKSSYGDSFAKEITPMLKGKKALFVRAKVVTSELNRILRDSGVDLKETILYETKCIDNSLTSAPVKNSVIIFSSPSTIECFFRYFEWDESYKAVIIGKKSASYMPRDIDFVVAKEQTIKSSIELAKSLSQNSVKF
jgi:uroporphyrinogen-III synthase